MPEVENVHDRLEDAPGPTAFDSGYLEWKSWDAGEFGRYSPQDSVYYAAEFGVDSLRQARVLEIGFGNGSVLAWLRDAGADTFGVEANPLLIGRAEEFLGPGRAFADLEDMALSRLSGTFTHVIGLDVLEHVPMEHLPAMLSRVRSLLAPRGRAVFRFPNGDSPFGRVYQHGDPTHITTLGSIRVAYLARRTGFEVVAVRSPALPVRGTGLVRGCRRLLIRGARHLIESAFGIVYFGGKRIPLDPNYTAVLMRPD